MSKPSSLGVQVAKLLIKIKHVFVENQLRVSNFPGKNELVLYVVLPAERFECKLG
jgi:hypothetical protein